MRNPGTDGNRYVMNINPQLLENMANRFPHMPDFAWISHKLSLNVKM